MTRHTITGRKAEPCRTCGWRPTTRTRREGGGKTPDWRLPGEMGVLFARRPDLAQTTTTGARLMAAVCEGA